jgi:hypothetical protein
VIVIPVGGALDAGQLPAVVTPDEPPVATPDEPLPLPEDDAIAPVDATPLDGLPVAEPEPVDGDMVPDVTPVPLLVPPLEVPLCVLASGNGVKFTKPIAGGASPWCSCTPQHAASSEMAKHCPTGTYLETAELGLALRRFSGKLTMRFGMLPPRKNVQTARTPSPSADSKTSSHKVTKTLTQVYAGNGHMPMRAIRNLNPNLYRNIAFPLLAFHCATRATGRALAGMTISESNTNS